MEIEFKHAARKLDRGVLAQSFQRIANFSSMRGVFESEGELHRKMCNIRHMLSLMKSVTNTGPKEGDDKQLLERRKNKMIRWTCGVKTGQV